MKRIILASVLAVFLVFGFTASQAGQVIFEWDANSESDLVGYRLYQSLTSGSYEYGEENAIGVVPAGTETFTLTTSVDGAFFWVVTAYDSAGNESGPSNEVTADLNFQPPAPPAGCVLRIPGN